MLRLFEKDVPNLVFPGLNPKDMGIMRRIKVGDEGQIYIPRRSIGKGEVEYHDIEHGLDAAIRYASHVRANLSDILKRRSEAAVDSARFADFQQARDQLFDINDAGQRKYMDFSWILEHAFDYIHSALRGAETITGQLAISDLFNPETKRSVGPLWNVYYTYTQAEIYITRSALERVHVKPYLTTAKSVIELASEIPTMQDYGEGIDQTWRAFIQEGKAQRIFNQMNIQLALVLREHANPQNCCLDDTPQAA